MEIDLRSDSDTVSKVDPLGTMRYQHCIFMRVLIFQKGDNLTILVTGGAGFIGANFVLDWLETTTEAVVNLDALTYAGNPDNLAPLHKNRNHVFVKGDIGDQGLLTGLLAKHQPRAIVNFAAESHVDRSISGPADFIKTNVLGTYNLLECARSYWTGLAPSARDAFRLLHISTDEVFGSLAPAEQPFTEMSLYQPNSPYSASKASSDHLVRAWHHTFGLPVLTTNCSNNYGPLQFPEKLIPVTILAALNGSSIPVYGDGRQVRDWLFVNDHCTAVRTVLECGRIGQTYNIGGLNELPNIEVVEMICKLLDQMRPRADGGSYTDQISHVTDRPGHDRRYAIDSSRITKELGWKPRETFDSGMRKTVKWYLENQEWVERVVTGAYREFPRFSGADS